MKKSILIAITLIMIAALPVCAADIKYGSLNIFTKTSGSSIFVDGELKGSDRAQIQQIQAGTHFIKVTTIVGAVIFANIVEVKAGEVTSVYVDEAGNPKQDIEPKEKEVDVFRTKKIIDYSREMHTGWYVKIAYLTNLYYSLDTPSLDNAGATFDLGLGFKVPLAPGIDFSLEMERASLSSSKNSWYFMPITANIQLSYLPSPYFRGKQYYGLGIGYYMTDLDTSLKENLTAMGYHLFYGMEMPASDENAFFFQFGYHVADMSRYNYSLNAAYASAGYRWDVLK